jgi:hypothetical protein
MVFVETHLFDYLRLTAEDIDSAGGKQKARIEEAIAWPQGSGKDDRKKQVIWAGGPFEVSLSKPGKEALPDWEEAGKRPNPNDMLPLVTTNGVPAKNASFTDIFAELISCRPQPELGRLLGTLLVRSAFMADHIEVTKGKWRYIPQTNAVAEIENGIPVLYGVSTTAFLHYLDALAWNEDVKYATIKDKKGRSYDFAKGHGRYNNVMTCAHFLAADIGVVSFADVLGPLARNWGVAPIKLPAAYEAFPLLGTYSKPARKRRQS